MKKWLGKTELKWALIFVLVSLLWMMMEKALGWHDEKLAQQQWLTLLFIPVGIGVYVFALLDKRKNDLHGRMTWKKGFASGMGITLIITLLAPLTQYIISTWITPQYFDNVIQYTIEHQMMTPGEANAQFNLNNYMLQSTVFSLVSGVLTSALVALFVKNR